MCDWAYSEANPNNGGYAKGWILCHDGQKHFVDLRKFLSTDAGFIEGDTMCGRFCWDIRNEPEYVESLFSKGAHAARCSCCESLLAHGPSGG